MEKINIYQDDILLFSVIVIFVFCIAATFWFKSVEPLMQRREYIRMEMKRSADKDRYLHWKKELIRLYLRSIPFIGRFFR